MWAVSRLAHIQPEPGLDPERAWTESWSVVLALDPARMRIVSRSAHITLELALDPERMLTEFGSDVPTCVAGGTKYALRLNSWTLF